MSVAEAFGDIADVIASLGPEKIIELQPPKTMVERLEVLINKKKGGNIDSEETAELEKYMALDLLISLAKAKARGLLAA